MKGLTYAAAALALALSGVFASVALAGNGGGHTPVEVCHKPGTPAEQTLTVDDDAVPAHLDHGDYLGACNTAPPTTTTTEDPPPTTTTTVDPPVTTTTEEPPVTTTTEDPPVTTTTEEPPVTTTTEDPPPTTTDETPPVTTTADPPVTTATPPPVKASVTPPPVEVPPVTTEPPATTPTEPPPATTPSGGTAPAEKTDKPAPRVLAETAVRAVGATPTLPFTGIRLGLVALIGIGLAGLGLALRRAHR